jgi:hypothetical protein
MVNPLSCSFSQSLRNVVPDEGEYPLGNGGEINISLKFPESFLKKTKICQSRKNSMEFTAPTDIYSFCLVKKCCGR